MSLAFSASVHIAQGASFLRVAISSMISAILSLISRLVIFSFPVFELLFPLDYTYIIPSGITMSTGMGQVFWFFSSKSTYIKTCRFIFHHETRGLVYVGLLRKRPCCGGLCLDATSDRSNTLPRFLKPAHHRRFADQDISWSSLAMRGQVLRSRHLLP